MLAVLAALAVQAAPPALQGTHEPIREWKYQRKDLNPRSGREEVSLEISGDEATPIDLTPKREIFEVKGVEATYYTDPKPPQRPGVERIRIRARRARMDNGAGLLLLQDLVRVERPGPRPSDPATILSAPEAVLTFRAEFTCPSCGFREAGEGSCPFCEVPLRARTTVTVEAPRDFDLAGPSGTVRGEGLVAEDDLADLTVARHGYLEVVGDPQALSRPSAEGGAAPRRLVSQLACRGPLAIRETEPGRRRISARDGVRLDRIDETGTQTALADRMEIFLGSRTDPATLKSAPVLERVEAAGGVRLEAVAFAEGREISARADAMVVERRSFDDFEVGVTRLSGAPAQLAAGNAWIRASRISLEQPFGEAFFEGDVDARLADVGAAPLYLRSRTLAARMTARGDDVETVDAAGEVRLEGIAGGGRASADRFVWNRTTESGLLEAARAVSLEQGATRVLAPRILLRDGGRSVLLQGPKQIVFVQERPEGRTELRASSEGDILYDAAAGRIRMEERCLLRTPDFRLSADRVDATLDPVKRELSALSARGAVRAWRASENVLLSGDRLAYDPARQEFRLRGTPHAVASAGRATTLQEEIVLYERAGGQVTEMRGGSKGVRIVIPEEPR